MTKNMMGRSRNKSGYTIKDGEEFIDLSEDVIVIEPDLLMECVDDKLSPAQKDHYARAVREYNAAKQAITTAQKQNVHERETFEQKFALKKKKWRESVEKRKLELQKNAELEKRRREEQQRLAKQNRQLEEQQHRATRQAVPIQVNNQNTQRYITMYNPSGVHGTFTLTPQVESIVAPPNVSIISPLSNVLQNRQSLEKDPPSIVIEPNPTYLSSPPVQAAPHLSAPNQQIVSLTNNIQWHANASASAASNSYSMLRSPVIPLLPAGRIVTPSASTSTCAYPNLSSVPGFDEQSGVLNIEPSTDVDDPATSQANSVHRRRPKGSADRHQSRPPNELLETINQFYDEEEGSSNFNDNPGTHTYKCSECNIELVGNVFIMDHLASHYQCHRDAQNALNTELADITYCRYCFKTFKTPYLMQQHTDTYHNNSYPGETRCGICDKNNSTLQQLLQHLNTVHKNRTTPYVCQICKFRTYSHVNSINHFRQVHNKSSSLLCTQCLQIHKPRLASDGTRNCQSYYKHLLAHFDCKSYKCKCCKLLFLSKNLMQAHYDKVQNHKFHEKGQDGNTSKHKGRGRSQLHGSQPLSLNAMMVTKRQRLSELKIVGKNISFKRCFECRDVLRKPQHFSIYTHCSNCRYATNCFKTFEKHTQAFHKGRKFLKKRLAARERSLATRVICSCGYNTKFGNKMAHHLVKCNKNSCLWDRTMQGLPEVAVKPRSLFDALGLQRC